MYLKHITWFLTHSVFSIFNSECFLFLIHYCSLNDNALKMFSFGLFSFGKFTRVGRNAWLKHLDMYVALGRYWHLLYDITVVVTVINNSTCAIFTKPLPALEITIF